MVSEKVAENVCSDHYQTTAPILKGDLKIFQWGPNGDLIFCEMGTKWGPWTAEMGTQKRIFEKLTETS